MPVKMDELDVFIGNKIRLLRKQHNVGLKYVAPELGVSLQQLHKYETGINRIPGSLLYKIASIFNISIETFFVEFREIKEKPANGTGFNILLINDDIRDECIIRQAISGFSEKINLYSIRGYEVPGFLRNANNHYVKPDMVFLELHMFKLNGLNLLKDIKRNRNYNSIPIVVITGSISRKEMYSSYNLQIGGVIVKSCSFSSFQEQICNALFYWTQLVKLPIGGE